MLLPCCKRIHRFSLKPSFEERAVSTLEDRSRPKPSSSPATVDLHEIQATVLRYRPEPYYGTHVLLHIEDARAAASSCGGSRRMSLPRPTGGTRQTPGLQLRSAIPAWRHWVCRRSRFKAFRRRFEWGWRRVPTSFSTAARTIRRTGTSRSAAGGFTSPSASSATPKKSGAAPWSWRGSSIRDFPVSPCWNSGLRRPAG